MFNYNLLTYKENDRGSFIFLKVRVEQVLYRRDLQMTHY